MERVVIINDECQLVSINNTSTNLSERTTLVLINEDNLKIQLKPTIDDDLYIIIDDENYHGKKLLKKCEGKHVLNYLSEWIKRTERQH